MTVDPARSPGPFWTHSRNTVGDTRSSVPIPLFVDPDVARPGSGLPGRTLPTEPGCREKQLFRPPKDRNPNQTPLIWGREKRPVWVMPGTPEHSLRPDRPHPSGRGRPRTLRRRAVLLCLLWRPDRAPVAPNAALMQPGRLRLGPSMARAASPNCAGQVHGDKAQVSGYRGGGGLPTREQRTSRRQGRDPSAPRPRLPQSEPRTPRGELYRA